MRFRSIGVCSWLADSWELAAAARQRAGTVRRLERNRHRPELGTGSGATVTAVNKELARVRTVVTAPTALYRILDLDPGRYSVPSS